MFRICTENVNQNTIIEIVGKKFESFNIISGVGFWKGQQENSLTIEIVGDDIKIEDINAIAMEIKNVNKQDAVLVQKIENNNWLI